MYWVHMKRRKLLVGSITVVGMLLVGTYTLMSFLVNPAFGRVEKSEVAWSGSLTVQGNETKWKDFGVLSPYDYIASFTISDATIKSCYPLDETLFNYWQEGLYEPIFVEMDRADYKLSTEPLEFSAAMGKVYLRFFIFVNEDSYAKEVQCKITRVWHETNYLPILSGIALIPIGMIMGIGLKVDKLQIGYLACSYVTAFLMMPFFLDLAWNAGHSPIFAIVSNIQNAMVFASLPLGSLIYLWLEKGDGSTCLESWNVGEKLRIVGFFLLSGVLINAALITIDALTLWNFSSFRVEIEHGVTRVPNPLYFGLFGISCAMILSGIVVFSGLWLRKSELLA